MAFGDGSDVAGCFPDPVSIAVLPDQSTWTAYKGNEPARWKGGWAWVDPASGAYLGPEAGGGGLGEGGLNGAASSMFQLLFGVALGYALAYAGTKAYRKWKTR
jgi:hypothetical protein